MRRHGRRWRSTVARASSESRIRSSLPYSWCRADEYTVDGGTGKTASFPDRVNAGTGIRAVTASHAMAQANTTYQVVLPVASSIHNNQLAATFSAHYYVSSSTAAAWRCLHDGTGMDMIVVYSLDSVTGNKYFMATKDSNAQAGWQLTRVGTIAQSIISNIGAVIVAPIMATAQVITTPYYDECTYVEGASPESAIYRKSALEGSGNTTAAPALGDPLAVLHLGDRPAVTHPFVGKWCETLIMNRVMTAAERANVRAYIASRYGFT